MRFRGPNGPKGQARKSLRWCLAGLRVGWFDPIAEVSELSEHSGRALLLRLFGDRWAPVFVSNALGQDQPDQATLSMRNGSDGLCVPKTRYHSAIHNFEDASFGLYGGVRSLIE